MRLILEMKEWINKRINSCVPQLNHIRSTPQFTVCMQWHLWAVIKHKWHSRPHMTASLHVACSVTTQQAAWRRSGIAPSLLRVATLWTCFKSNQFFVCVFEWVHIIHLSVTKKSPQRCASAATTPRGGVECRREDNENQKGFGSYMSGTWRKASSDGRRSARGSAC